MRRTVHVQHELLHSAQISSFMHIGLHIHTTKCTQSALQLYAIVQVNQPGPWTLFCHLKVCLKCGLAHWFPFFALFAWSCECRLQLTLIQAQQLLLQLLWQSMCALACASFGATARNIEFELSKFVRCWPSHVNYWYNAVSTIQAITATKGWHDARSVTAIRHPMLLQSYTKQQCIQVCKQ